MRPGRGPACDAANFTEGRETSGWIPMTRCVWREGACARCCAQLRNNNSPRRVGAKENALWVSGRKRRGEGRPARQCFILPLASSSCSTATSPLADRRTLSPSISAIRSPGMKW